MMSKNDLDPFRALLGVLAGLVDSDLLANVMSATGLRFDLSLSDAEAYSHKTRVRAFLPRIVNAYDALDDQNRLGVARAALATLNQQRGDTYTRVTEVLEKIGWEIRDGELLATTPDLREMFFPKDSPWDAFVVLRNVFAEAQTELTIVDAYCDGTVFQMLAARASTSLRVRILCSRHAPAVATEAKLFVAQHSEAAIEVRQTKDFHDRFIVIDGQSCVHVGASIKDAGKTAFMISRVEDQQNRDNLLAAIDASWNAASPVP